jgi:four helix bundle protein
VTSQIRRGVGYGRKTTADYIKSLYIAYGSNCELETQMMLSGDLDTIDSAILEDIMDEIYEVERMLKALIKSLENKHLNP